MGQGERTFFPLNKIKCEWEANKIEKAAFYCMSYCIIGYSFLFYELYQLGFYCMIIYHNQYVDWSTCGTPGCGSGACPNILTSLGGS